jgi:hypothetical protein
LQVDRSWSQSSDRALIFASSQHARNWIETRPAAYWLHDVAGRARVISARAAGVVSRRE